MITLYYSQHTKIVNASEKLVSSINLSILQRERNEGVTIQTLIEQGEDVS